MEDIDFLLDAYYTGRGWDKNGIPTEATLVEMGLQDVAESMKQLGLLS